MGATMAEPSARLVHTLIQRDARRDQAVSGVERG